MSIISEINDFLNIYSKIFSGGWKKLNEHEISPWALRKAKERYRKLRNPKIGKRIHLVGKNFFYRVWFRGSRDWVFYKKKK